VLSFTSIVLCCGQWFHYRPEILETATPRQRRLLNEHPPTNAMNGSAYDQPQSSELSTDPSARPPSLTPAAALPATVAESAPEQAAAVLDDGYVLLRGCLSEAAVATLQQRLDAAAGADEYVVDSPFNQVTTRKGIAEIIWVAFFQASAPSCNRANRARSSSSTWTCRACWAWWRAHCRAGTAAAAATRRPPTATWSRSEAVVLLDLQGTFCRHFGWNLPDKLGLLGGR